jgi:putative spermidine/putrescine transport system substrate-binding protein
MMSYTRLPELDRVSVRRLAIVSPVAAGAFIVALAVAAQPPAARAQSLDDLVAAAKAEGQLTVIALPHDWCGYGRAIEAFRTKYGLTINELNPNANAGEQIEALKANKENRGPQAPDVIELGLPFGVSAKADGLTQAYKVSTWDSIPASLKDPDGFWTGDYYGVLSFEINTDLVHTLPNDWSDLLAAGLKNSIALSGNPRTSSQSIMGVYAAGLSANHGTSAGAAEAGLRFFAELNRRGNFVPANGQASALAQGTTPIVIRWDYLALTDRDTLKGNPGVAVVVPKTGVIAGLEVQAISAQAPHPNAARLWLEYLYSDESQLNYLSNYCHSVRFQDLLERDRLSAELLARLPPADGYARAVSPSLDELRAAKEIISQKWDDVVSGTIK